VHARAVLFGFILPLGPSAGGRVHSGVVLAGFLLTPRVRPLGQEHHPRAVDDVRLDVSNIHQLAHVSHSHHVVVGGPSDLVEGRWGRERGGQRV